MRPAGRSIARYGLAKLGESSSSPILRAFQSSISPSNAGSSDISRNSPCTLRSRQYSQLAFEVVPKADELADSDIFGRKPTSSFLKARLKSLLNPASSSTAPAPSPNALEILEVAVPLIGTPNESLLVPHIKLIATAIGNHFERHLPTDDRQVADVLKVLGVCWLRSIQGAPSHSDTNPPRPRVLPLHNQYTTFLMGIARGQSNAQRLLDTLTSLNDTLRVVLDKTSGKIPTEILVALIMLRVRTGTTAEMDLRIRLPPMSHTLDILETSVTPAGELEPYTREAGIFYQDVTRNSIPTTPTDLERKLESMKGRGEVEEMINIWEGFRDARRTTDSSSPWNSLLTSSNGDETYAVFLYAFKSKKQTFTKQQITNRLNSTAADIMANLPRPIPLAVHQKLMYLRATMDDIPLSLGTEVRSLDELPEELTQSARDVAHTKLQEAWKAVNSEGIAKDVRIHLTYIEGLGRLGDLEGVQNAWNNLVADKQARELYYSTEDSKKPFPPTKALNHMIASCLLVSGSGPDVALELFRQASLPTSTIPIDLVTVNIILRHCAVKRDIPGMASLFSLAQSHKLKPDVITYTTLVQGLLRADQLDKAKRTLATMQKQGIMPNERMYSLLIADLARNGSREGLIHAEMMMKEMRKRGLVPGAVTWTGLLSGYFRGGWENEGWAALKRMTETGKRLNRVGYNMVLRQALLSRSIGRTSGSVTAIEGSSLAIKLLHRMVKEGYQPSGDTFSIVLGPLVKLKRWQEAGQVLDMMVKQGYKPNGRSLKSLVSTCLSSMPRDLARGINL